MRKKPKQMKYNNKLKKGAKRPEAKSIKLLGSF